MLYYIILYTHDYIIRGSAAAENAAERAAEDTAESVAESAAESMVESVAENMVESVAERVAEAESARGRLGGWIIQYNVETYDIIQCNII